MCSHKIEVDNNISDHRNISNTVIYSAHTSLLNLDEQYSAVTVSAQRDYIQDQIQKHVHASQIHQDAILKLRSRFNELAPISRLPTEMLAKVFFIHVNDHLHTVYKWHPRYWIAFSHVSRYWRTVSLNCPTLWSFIPLDAGANCILEFQSRTRKAPLSITTHRNVDFRNGAKKFAPATKMVLMNLLAQEMWRICELRIPLHSQFPIVGSAAALRKLEILDSEGTNLKSFFKIINGEDAPQLRCMRIFSSSFKWCPMRHSNLRLFDLRRRWDSCDKAAPVDNIIAALDGMPLLEVLRLQHCLPKRVPSSRSGDRVARLPHLRQVTLHSDIRTCIHFLTYLRLPSATSISLKGQRNFSEPDFQRIDFQWPILSHCSLFLRNTGIRAVFIVGDNLSRSSPRFTLKGDTLYGHGLSSMLDIFFQIVSLSQVEILTISDNVDMSDRFFRGLVSRTPNLQVLRLAASLNVLNPLSVFVHTIPHLKVLEMSSVSFNPKMLDVLERLRDKVMNCGIEARIKIKEIIYHECNNVDESVISRFREITGALEHKVVTSTHINIDDAPGDDGYDKEDSNDSADEDNKYDSSTEIESDESSGGYWSGTYDDDAL